MVRDALVVGINKYEHIDSLQAPAHDAEAIAHLLSEYGEFQVKRLPETVEQKQLRVGKKTSVSQDDLEEALIRLFKPEGSSIPDTALFYFSGHGMRVSKGGVLEGFLVTSDGDERCWGVSFKWLQELLAKSPVQQKVVILDCCHSGEFITSLNLLSSSSWQGRDRCFIAASREFESSWEDLESPLSTVTKILFDGLDPCRHQKPIFRSTDLDQYLYDHLAGVTQRPIVERVGEPIILVRTSSTMVSESGTESFFAGELPFISPKQTIPGPEPDLVPVRSFVRTERTIEPENSFHLVIAFYIEGTRKRRKVRVRPNLYYRDRSTKQVLQKPLAKDHSPIDLDSLPQSLEDLVNRTTEYLANKFRDRLQPWLLSIKLFVPIDWLGAPLHTWCGKAANIFTRYSIVVGCSDRFNDGYSGAAELHNQLKRGWQRFQADAPDSNGARLTQLNWLDSDQATMSRLEDYSGFRCFGDWLGPGEQYLEGWKEIVSSGIPIALWMCEGHAERPEREAIFNSLIVHSRFQFLEEIRRTRDLQRKSSQTYVGVFYEDPNYVPNVFQQNPMFQVRLSTKKLLGQMLRPFIGDIP
ncbi:MAG: caspase family protein [Elainellaceae cyanobacterium]